MLIGTKYYAIEKCPYRVKKNMWKEIWISYIVQKKIAIKIKLNLSE